MQDSLYTQIYEYTSIQLSSSPSDCKWLPYTNKTVVLSQTHSTGGLLQVLQISNQKLQEFFVQNFEHGLKCSQWIQTTQSDYAQLALGDIKGNLFIYDLEKHKKSFQVKAHDMIINSIDCLGGMTGHGAPEILTGS